MSETQAVVVREESRAQTTGFERESIKAALLQRLPDLLPPGASVERFVAMTMQAIAKSPDLAECDGASILMAALDAAQVGLEPTGAMGGAHIVGFRVNVAPKGQQPRYEKRAQLIYDYRGLQHLIREGGGGEVKAVLVYEGDYFKAIEGTGGVARIEHEPAFETTDPTKIRFCYAYPLDHPEKYEVMTKEQIDGVRARSKGANNGPWVTDYGQQARKTTIKRLSQYLELKPETRQRLEQDAEREFGDGVVSDAGPSRTASVKASIAARLNPGKAAVPAQDAPGAPDKAQVDVSSPPDVSASQPTESDTTADPVEASEVCGATSDPALGDALTCVLSPGHAFPDGKLSGHQSSEGSKFPNKASAR